MQILFSQAGFLAATDYWACEAGALSGRPWCCVHSGIWHALLPEQVTFPSRSVQAVAQPVLTCQEPERWLWKVWITPDLIVRVPLSCWPGGAPALPEPGARVDRQLRVYGCWVEGLSNHRPQWGFGLLEGGGPVCVYAAPLLIERVRRSR